MGLQRSMWLDLNTLLSVKIECHRDALEAGSGGTLSVNKGAETFTLSQNGCPTGRNKTTTKNNNSTEFNVFLDERNTQKPFVLYT